MTNEMKRKMVQELTEIRKKLTKDNPRPNYPDPIKQKVRILLSSGINCHRLAKATGISEGAITKWKKQRDVPVCLQSEVRVLPVVKNDPPKTPNKTNQPILVLRTDSLEISIFSHGV